MTQKGRPKAQSPEVRRADTLRLDALRQRAFEELYRFRLTCNMLKAGRMAPVFALADTQRNVISSEWLLAQSPLVLQFLCNGPRKSAASVASTLRPAAEEISALDAQMFLISPEQGEEASVAGVQILVDEGCELAAAFGLRWHVPDHLQALYLEIVHAAGMQQPQATPFLSAPARYVIGQDGVIAYAELGINDAQTSEAGDLLPTLKRLRRR